MTCSVLVDPITSLLLTVVWKDVTVSCLSAGFRHSSGTQKGQRWTDQKTQVHLCSGQTWTPETAHPPPLKRKQTDDIKDAPLMAGNEKGAAWPSRSRSRTWRMKAAWSAAANGISLSLSSCFRLLWKRSSSSSLGGQEELGICSSFSTAENMNTKQRTTNSSVT